MSKKKLSHVDLMRRRENARKYRESHLRQIRLYAVEVRKQRKKFRDAVFEGFLRNPRELLDSVKVRKI